MDSNKFCEELKSLCESHEVILLGAHRITPLEKYKQETVSYAVVDTVEYGGIKDRSGTFLLCEAELVPAPKVEFKPQRCRIAVLDRERVMYDGIRSPIDNSMHYSRASYDDHLKRHDCVVVEDSRQSTQAKIEAKRRAKEESESTPFEWSTPA